MDTVFSYFSNLESLIDSSFNEYVSIIMAWSQGLIAIAFLIVLVFSAIIPMLNEKPVDTSKFLTFFLIYSMFTIYPTFIGYVDGFAKYPASLVQNDIRSSFPDFTKEFNSGFTPDKGNDNKGTVDKLMDTAAMIGSLPVMVMAYIYGAIMYLAVILLFIVVLLIKFTSVITADSIIVLGPLAVALSFLPGYSGLLTNLIKVLIAVRLWPFMSGLFLKVCVTAGAFKTISNVLNKSGQIFAGNFTVDSAVDLTNAFDLTPLIVILFIAFMILGVPKIVDMVLNASTGGAMGSALGAGLVASAITSTITGGMSSTLGSVFKSGDAGKQDKQNEYLQSIDQTLKSMAGSNSSSTPGNDDGNGDSGVPTTD